MEKARRGIKDVSVLILIFAVLSFIDAIVNVFIQDINLAILPEGITTELVLAAKITICVIGFIVLVPQVYVGVKGFKISENPDYSKAHIVWAIILAVLSILGIISPISNIIKNADLIDNLFALADAVIEAIAYILYVLYAKQIIKEA